MRQQKLDEAITAFREAIRLEPNEAFHQVNLGHALESQEKFDLATDAYREAIRLQPCNAGRTRFSEALC